jgi:hypothetical protein
MQQIFQVTAQGFAQSYRGIFLDLPNCNHYSCSNFDLPLRAYPNNRLVMRPSEKFEAKAAGQKCSEAWFSPR